MALLGVLPKDQEVRLSPHSFLSTSGPDYSPRGPVFTMESPILCDFGSVSKATGFWVSSMFCQIYSCKVP